MLMDVMRDTEALQPNGRQLVGLTAWSGGVNVG